MNSKTYRKFTTNRELMSRILRDVLKELTLMEVDVDHDIRDLGVVKSGRVDWDLLAHFMYFFADMKSGMSINLGLDDHEKITEFLHEQVRDNIPYVIFKTDVIFVLTNEVKDTFFIGENDEHEHVKIDLGEDYEFLHSLDDDTDYSDLEVEDE